MQLHVVAHETSAGTTTLIPAPGPGYRITIVGLHISAGSAGAVALSFSSGNQRVWDMAANQSADPSPIRWEGDTNAALSLTAPATGPTDVTVDYETEVSPS
jgi:hypothetical protein